MIECIKLLQELFNSAHASKEDLETLTYIIMDLVEGKDSIIEELDTSYAHYFSRILEKLKLNHSLLPTETLKYTTIIVHKIL